jgi:hypothetical protein
MKYRTALLLKKGIELVVLSALALAILWWCKQSTPTGTLRGETLEMPDTLPQRSTKTAVVQEQIETRDKARECTWSGRKYPYPYWSSERGTAFVNTIKALNAAGVSYFLTDGALIGAYRHGGPVPCDGDMDIVFPTWLNGLATCNDASVPKLQGYEKENEALLTLCGKTRKEYVAMTPQWLREHVPNIRSIDPRNFGGLRVDFAGIGVDWIVSILDQSYLHEGPLCRCRFGDTYAWCIEGSLTLLQRLYGQHVLTPDRKVQQCLKTEQTLHATYRHSPVPELK